MLTMIKNLFKRKEMVEMKIVPRTTYEALTICKNCGHSQDVCIKLGETIKVGLKGVECDNCECKKLGCWMCY